MTVSLDAVGPASPPAGPSGTSPLTWSHPGGASPGIVYVAASVDAGTPATMASSCTYGGTAMTVLQDVLSGGAAQSSGYLRVWYLLSPPGGAQTVAVTFPGSSNDTRGASASFNGATGSGTPVTADSAGAGVTSGTVTVPGTSAGNMVLAAVADGSGAISWTAGTSRWATAGTPCSSAACASGGATAPGGGSVTFTWTQAADFYAAVAVEVQGPAAPAPPPAPPLTAQPGAAWRSRYQSRALPRPQAFLPSASPASSTPSGADASAAADGAEAAGTADSDAGTAADAGESASVFTPPVNPPVLVAQPGPALRSRRLPRGAARPAHLVPAAAPPPAPAVLSGSAAAGDGSKAWFTDQHGVPLLYTGEDAWNIIWEGGAWNSGNYQATFDTYLGQRAAQGYNAVEVSCFSYPNPDNVAGSPSDGSDWDGTWPFTSTNNPSSGLNAVFWARRDYFLAAAGALGITVQFSVSTPALAAAGDMPGAWTTAQWTALGTALGGRYKSAPNILWIVGDDYFGTSDTGLAAFLSALRAAGDTHLMSIQNMQETTSRYAYNPTHSADPNSFDVNAQFDWVYTYNTPYNGVTYAQQHEPSVSDVVAGPVPPVWGDGFYLASGVAAGQTDTRLERQNIWWALSSGACGFATGDNDIWSWGSGSAAQVTAKSFYTSVVPAIVAAFSALPGWHLLVSDFSSALVTAGRGTPAADIATGGTGYTANTDAYVSASRVPDGSLAVIYCAKAFSITIDQTKLAAGYTATWVDPVTGASSAGTAGSTYNSATAKGSNSAGDPDWVLVLAAPPGPVTVSDSDASPAAEGGSLTAALAGSDAGAASDAGPPAVSLGSAESGSAADAGGPLTAALASSDAGTAADAGEHVNTGGGSAVSDSDAVRAEDSGFAYPASAETAAGADAGEAVRVTGAEASPAADRETAAWPASADASPAAEAQYWSGPLSSPGDPSPGADAGERVRVASADAASGSDQAPVVEIYTYQPPFRWTGGGYELVWHAAAGPGGFTGITVWRGPRPDGAVFRLFSVLALSDEVRLAHDADACPAADEADPVLASVTVTAGPALAVVVQAREG